MKISFKRKNINNNIKIIISCICSVLTYLLFFYQDIIPGYMQYNLLLFFLLPIFYLYFYNIKINNLNKKKLIMIFAFALIFSIMFVTGRIVNAYIDNYSIDLIDEIFSYRSIGNIILIYPLFCSLLIYIFNFALIYFFDNKKIRNKGNLIWRLSMVIILLGWFPYFLSLYPGTLSPDTISQFSQFIPELNIYSDHHPVLHTLFMSFFYNVGYKIFDSANAGVATISIAQMVIMASIFSYLIKYLYKKGVNNLLLVIFVIYYALSPIWGYYSVTMWKDCLFSAFILLFLIELTKMIDSGGISNSCGYLKFIFSALLLIFFRNNAFYIFILLTPFIIMKFKNNQKLWVFIILGIIMLYLFVKGPIFSYNNISKSSSSEYIAMPLQQIGRIVVKDKILNRDEIIMIEKLLPISEIKKTYNPRIADGIKFNKNFNINEFNNNKIEYLKIWLQLIIKQPKTIVEGYLCSTLGYWYPNVMNWSVSNNIYVNDFNIYTNPKAPVKIINYTKKIEDRSLPIINMQWSIGLCFWIIFILFIISCLKHSKYILVYFPILGLWITMIIASPVFGEFRYVVGFFSTLPLLMCLPFLKNNNEGVEEK